MMRIGLRLLAMQSFSRLLPIAKCNFDLASSIASVSSMGIAINPNQRFHGSLYCQDDFIRHSQTAGTTPGATAADFPQHVRSEEREFYSEYMMLSASVTNIQSSTVQEMQSYDPRPLPGRSDASLYPGLSHKRHEPRRTGCPLFVLNDNILCIF